MENVWDVTELKIVEDAMSVQEKINIIHQKLKGGVNKDSALMLLVGGKIHKYIFLSFYISCT